MKLDERNMSDSKKAIMLKSIAMKRIGVKPIDPKICENLRKQMNDRSIASRKHLNSKESL
ncbi:MAG: hypothetical protein COA86_02245 [Kangiella sp.]|nr:MAG: hypothetical protein COA86_02245 [Kangiella sp.]